MFVRFSPISKDFGIFQYQNGCDVIIQVSTVKKDLAKHLASKKKYSNTYTTIIMWESYIFL